MGGAETLEALYDLGDELGRGAFGTVLRATPKGGGPPVAVKLVHAALAASQVERIQREARLLARLSHPRLARLLGCHPAREGQLALVYQLVEGPSLEKAREGRKLPVARVVEYVRDLADGLDALHAAGLVHRDLKPDNALVGPDGRLVLIDFGLARPATEGETLTRTGTVMGTAHYMAPEQIRGERLGPATDTYALACVAYELFTGQTPFEGTLAEIVAAHLGKEPPRLQGLRPDLPGAVGPWLAKAMAKDPRARFTSAGQLAAALEGALAAPRSAAGATEVLDGEPADRRTRAPADGPDPGPKGPERTVPLPGRSKAISRPPPPPAPPEPRARLPQVLALGALAALAGLLGLLTGGPGPPAPGPTAPPASGTPAPARLAAAPAQKPPIARHGVGRERSIEPDDRIPFGDRISHVGPPLGDGSLLLATREDDREGRNAETYRLVPGESTRCERLVFKAGGHTLRESSVLAPGSAPGRFWYAGQAAPPIAGTHDHFPLILAEPSLARTEVETAPLGDPAVPLLGSTIWCYPRPVGEHWAGWFRRAPKDGTSEVVLVASRAGGRPRTSRFLSPYSWFNLGNSLARLDDGWLVALQTDRLVDGQPAPEAELVGLGECADRLETPRFRLRLPGRPLAPPAQVPGGFLLPWDGALRRFDTAALERDAGPGSGRPIAPLGHEPRDFADAGENFLPGILVVAGDHAHLVAASSRDPEPDEAGAWLLPVHWLRFSLAGEPRPPDDLSFLVHTSSARVDPRFQNARGAQLLDQGRILFTAISQGPGFAHLLLLDLETARPLASHQIDRKDQSRHLAGPEPVAIELPDAIHAYLAPRSKVSILRRNELIEWRIPRDQIR